MTTLPLAPRILLVDDDPAGAELTMAAIAMLLPQTVIDVVDDGEEALDYVFRRGRFCERAPHAPGVMLLDLKMPKVDGHQVLREIRSDEQLRRMKVIVLTSSNQSSDRLLSHQLGSDGYVVKPDSIIGLMDVLRGHLTPLFTSSFS